MLNVWSLLSVYLLKIQDRSKIRYNIYALGKGSKGSLILSYKGSQFSWHPIALGLRQPACVHNNIADRIA